MSNERFIFSDLTAEDKETGLIWTRDANIAKARMEWEDALKFIEKLNKQKYAGYRDWRLPTIEAFKTLVDYAKSQGTTYSLDELFNNIGFKDVPRSSYWSSSTYAFRPADAWVVGMGVVYVLPFPKTFAYYVWPVRGRP